MTDKYAMSVTVGGGLSVHGSAEAINRVQDFILLDSTHPQEREDVRRSLMRQLIAAEAEIDGLRAHIAVLEIANAGFRKEREELLAENDRIEAALQHIADFPPRALAQEIRDFAKQALDSPVEM